MSEQNHDGRGYRFVPNQDYINEGEKYVMSPGEYRLYAENPDYFLADHGFVIEKDDGTRVKIKFFQAQAPGQCEQP